MARTQHILLPKGNLYGHHLLPLENHRDNTSSIRHYLVTWGRLGHYLCNTWELHSGLLGHYLGTTRALRTSCGLLEYLVNPLGTLRDHLQIIGGAYLCPIDSMAIISGKLALFFPLDFVQAIISWQRPDDWFLTATTPQFAKKMRK